MSECSSCRAGCFHDESCWRFWNHKALDAGVKIATQAAEIERLTRELDAARERSGELRMCLNCGKTRPANEGRNDLPECHHPDYPGLAGCTWQLTPQEAWQHWRKVAYDERTRAEAAEAETERLRARIDCAADMAEDMWRAPQGSLWNYGTTPSARERAKWEGVRETAQDLLSIIDPDRYRATLGQKP